MTVYTGSQAMEMMKSGSIPINSIGVFKSDDGWVYWYWDERIYDSDVCDSEFLALKAAQANS